MRSKEISRMAQHEEKGHLRILLLISIFFSLQVLAAENPPCTPDQNSGPVSRELGNLVSNTEKILASYGPSSRSAKCSKNSTAKNDPFDPAYEITTGDYRGQCIDSSTVRPPLILEEDDKKIKIANFYHDGRFWVATIPRDAVSSVIFQGVPFGKALMGLVELKHGQFRFKLDRPIELSEQGGSQSETVALKDLIISATATRPAGVSYSVLNGDNFGIATRVLSSTARGVEEISEDQSRIHQYELKMSPQKKSDFLLSAIGDAAKAGYKESYQLLDRNCTTVLFDSLDKAVAPGKEIEPFRARWWQLRDAVERPALQALRERQIHFKRISDMNEEMTCAKPGETLVGEAVERETLGAASAKCRFKGGI